MDILKIFFQKGNVGYLTFGTVYLANKKDTFHTEGGVEILTTHVFDCPLLSLDVSILLENLPEVDLFRKSARSF